MNFADLVKRGIQTGNWQDVCDGLAAVTGEKLEPPECFTKRPSAAVKKQGKSAGKGDMKTNALNEALDTLLDGTEHQKKRPSADEFAVKNDKEKGQKSCAVPDPPHENTWKDTMTLVKQELADSKKKSKERKKAGPREVREEYEPVELRCDVCKKVFKVHPGLRPVKTTGEDTEEPRWLCDRCIGRRK